MTVSELIEHLYKLQGNLPVRMAVWQKGSGGCSTCGYGASIHQVEFEIDSVDDLEAYVHLSVERKND